MSGSGAFIRWWYIELQCVFIISQSTRQRCLGVREHQSRQEWGSQGRCRACSFLIRAWQAGYTIDRHERLRKPDLYQSSIKSARRVHSAQKLPPLSSKRVHFSSQVAKSRKTAHCSSYQTTVSQLYIVNACQFKKSVSKHNLSESVCKRRGCLLEITLSDKGSLFITYWPPAHLFWRDSVVISSVRSSSVYHDLLHRYIPGHFSKFVKFRAILPIYIHNSLSFHSVFNLQNRTRNTGIHKYTNTKCFKDPIDICYIF